MLKIACFILLLFSTKFVAAGDRKCQDDNTYIHSKNDELTCRSVKYKEFLRRKFCKLKEVNESCPRTCGTCCQDDLTHQFQQNIQKNVNRIIIARKCAWMRKRKIRQTKSCHHIYNGTKVRECVRSCLNCPSIIPVEKPHLFFNNNNEGDGNRKSFKILQLADLHYGENPWTDWGPEQDSKSSKAIKGYLEVEKPDLVILSGDQMTALNINTNATSYLEKIIQTMLEVNPKIKWATVFGNHDDEPYHRKYSNGREITHDAKTSRNDLIRKDIGYNGSYTLQGGAPQFIFGSSNYLLPIYSENTEGKPLAQIFLFDSGGGSIPQLNKKSQVKWFQNKLKKSHFANVPSVVFQHIPTSAEIFKFKPGRLCKGHTYEGIAPVKSDSGLFEALSHSGQVHFLAVGHNHGNDYCCRTSNISICFGRHSGYGGYSTNKDNGGKWEKGVRVYILQVEEQIFSWSSYVRLENGDIADEYNPNEIE